jgi:excisionase family DNA binding protein
MDTQTTNLEWDLILRNPDLARKLTFQMTGEDLLTAIQKVAKSIGTGKQDIISDDERYLTVEQAANMLQVSRVTLWDWNKKGILPAFKIGRQVRYKLSDIQKIAEGREASHEA